MPRYDLPNHAPEPLRLVQRLVNTVDFERDRDWLAGLLAEEGIQATEVELDRALEVREAIRELLYANNRQATEGDPYGVLRDGPPAVRASRSTSRPPRSRRRRPVWTACSAACSQSPTAPWWTARGAV